MKLLVVYHLRRYWQGISPSESVKVRHSSLASENWTITWKRCKIGGKLLISNRKSYIHLYSPNYGNMNEKKIYIRRKKISNKNTEQN